MPRPWLLATPDAGTSASAPTATKTIAMRVMAPPRWVGAPVPGSGCPGHVGLGVLIERLRAALRAEVVLHAAMLAALDRAGPVYAHPADRVQREVRAGSAGEDELVQAYRLEHVLERFAAALSQRHRGAYGLASGLRA